MLKVGLIGAGTMGRTHKKAYDQLDHARVVAICDLQPEKAERIAGPDVKVVKDYMEILQDPEIDVVDVCLPTYLHREVVLKASAAGKHVFCEKPIALNIKDAEEMSVACAKAGVKLGVGHVVRFFPDYYRLKDVIASGRIGEPKVIRTSRGGSFPSRKDNWYADYSKSGGPIVDLIIHDFDFLLWLFGPVQRVFAKSVRGREMFDHTFVTLRFENGIIAHVEGVWSAPAGTPFSTSYEVAGTEGLYEYSSGSSTPLILRTSEGEQRGKSVPRSPLTISPYAAQLSAFFEAIEKDQPVPVSAQDAIKALEVALAAYQSASTGEVVWLGGTRHG